MTIGELPLFPAGSKAMAWMLCGPAAALAELQLKVGDEDVLLAISLPSIHNSTRLTATLSVAAAVIWTLVPTLVPLLGDFRFTDGEIVSVVEIPNCTVTTGDRPTLPAASYARASILYEPAVEPRVFQVNDAVDAVLLPMSLPFKYHSTLVTPTLSLALTDTVTFPDTVVPVFGDVT